MGVVMSAGAAFLADGGSSSATSSAPVGSSGAGNGANPTVARKPEDEENGTVKGEGGNTNEPPKDGVGNNKNANLANDIGSLGLGILVAVDTSKPNDANDLGKNPRQEAKIELVNDSKKLEKITKLKEDVTKFIKDAKGLSKEEIVKQLKEKAPQLGIEAKHIDDYVSSKSKDEIIRDLKAIKGNVNKEQGDLKINGKFVDLPNYGELDTKLKTLKTSLESATYEIKDREFVAAIISHMEKGITEIIRKKEIFGESDTRTIPRENYLSDLKTEIQNGRPKDSNINLYPDGTKLKYPVEKIMETETNQRKKAEGEKYQRAMTELLDKHIDEMAGNGKEGLDVDANIIKAISSVEANTTKRSGYNLDGSLNVRVEVDNLKKTLSSNNDENVRTFLNKFGTDEKEVIENGKKGMKTFDTFNVNGKENILDSSPEGQKIHQSVIEYANNNPALKEIILRNTSMGAFHIHGGVPKLSGNETATEMYNKLAKANQNPQVQVNMMKTFIQEKGGLKEAIKNNDFKEIGRLYSPKRGEAYVNDLITEYNKFPAKK